MADNVTLNSGAGGAVIATDDDGVAQHQYVKLEFGADNTFTKVSTADPLPVDIRAENASVTVDNAGTFAVQVDGAALTALQLIDNPVLVDDAAFTPAVSSVMMAGFEFDDVTPDVVNEGDAGAARMSSRREVYVQIRDAAGNERGLNVDASGLLGVTDGGGNLSVDWGGTVPPIGAGTEAAALRVTLATDSTGVVSVDDNGGNLSVDWGGTVPPIGAGTEAAALRVTIATDSTGVVSVDDNGGNLSVDWAGTVPPIGAGTEAAALRVTLATDSTGVLSVDDNGGALTVDNAGTFAVQVDGAALTALQLIDNAVVTEDAAAAANPDGYMVCAVRDDEVGATAVTTADNDVTALRCDRFGHLKITEIPDATSEVKDAVIDAATSGDNTLVPAAGVGIKIRVLSAFLIAAGTVNVRFESGAAGTALTGQMNLVANTGFVLPYNPKGWFETADNALLNLELSAAVSVDGCLNYVEI